jgi:hypothetical protein
VLTFIGEKGNRRGRDNMALQQSHLLLAINQLGRMVSETEAGAFMDTLDKYNFQRSVTRLIFRGYLVRRGGKGHCFYDITKKGEDYLLSLDKRTLASIYEDICLLVSEAKEGE